MQRVGRVKAFKRPPSGHIKKFFISQKIPTIIQKFALLIKSKNWNRLISNYVIVIYIIQNLKYRNNSIGQQLSTITNNLLNGELRELNEKTNVHYKKMRARLHI